MNPNVKHRLCSPILCLLCLVLGCVLGCSGRKPAPVVLSAPAQPAAEAAPSVTPPVPGGHLSQANYDRGVQAFDAGEYKKAAAAWKECLATETNPAARQRALFALVAVKLLQAGNETDLATAMDLFETWRKNSPPGGSGEDARFLGPVLQSFHPAFALKETKAAGEKECAKKLAEKTDQVRRMQQQVKALETIHREIQEKKKGLNNY